MRAVRYHRTRGKLDINRNRSGNCAWVGTMKKVMKRPRCFDETAFPLGLIGQIGREVMKLNPSIAVIFGSVLEKGLLAKDIDILVISDAFARHFRRNRERLLHLPQGFTYDLWLYTQEEFDAFCQQGHPMRNQIDNYHIDLRKWS